MRAAKSNTSLLMPDVVFSSSVELPSKSKFKIIKLLKNYCDPKHIGLLLLLFILNRAFWSYIWTYTYRPPHCSFSQWLNHFLCSEHKGKCSVSHQLAVVTFVLVHSFVTLIQPFRQ